MGDVVEIVIIAFVLYHFLVWIKSTRAWVLFKGLLVVLVFLLFAAIFQLNTIIWLAGRLASIAVIAFVIIFHPELRSALEQLGRKNSSAHCSASISARGQRGSVRKRFRN